MTIKITLNELALVATTTEQGQRTAIQRLLDQPFPPRYRIHLARMERKLAREADAFLEQRERIRKEIARKYVQPVELEPDAMTAFENLQQASRPQELAEKDGWQKAKAALDATLKAQPGLLPSLINVALEALHESEIIPADKVEEANAEYQEQVAELLATEIEVGVYPLKMDMLDALPVLTDYPDHIEPLQGSDFQRLWFLFDDDEGGDHAE
jgi:hypothetical protein